MEGLPVTCFALFVWDGKEAARYRRVCKQWRANIERVPRFARLIAWHFVKLHRIDDLRLELGTRYKQLKPKAMESALGTLILAKYDMNIQKLLLPIYNWHACIAPDAFAPPFGWTGECCYYLRDLITGDLVTVNNFYNGAPCDGIPDADWKSPFGRAYKGLSWLEQVAFPGIFTWKFIQFPFLQKGDFNLIEGVKFHRGLCFYMRFKCCGEIIIKKVTSSVLKKRKSMLNEKEKEFAREYMRRCPPDTSFPLFLDWELE